MQSFDQYVDAFIKGYIGSRTEGSSSKHKLPTRDDLWYTTDKYFSRAAAEQALTKLIEDGTIIEDSIYLCTEIIEVE